MLIKSYAKINIGLKITGVDEKGMHLLDSVACPISLCDDVYIELNNTDKIKISSDNPTVPMNEDNICYKAVQAFKETFKFNNGVDIKIIKRIPMMAGLGGGSTNAAAVIVGLNELLKCNFTEELLSKIGSKVGSDVPFFIHSTLGVIKGNGSNVERFKAKIDDICILLVKPAGGVSTKEAYAYYDKEAKESGEYKVKENLKKGDYNTLVKSIFNDLEEGATVLCPDILKVEKELRSYNFDYVGMSGSGSCVYALTKDRLLAQRVESELKGKYIFVKKVHFIS